MKRPGILCALCLTCAGALWAPAGARAEQRDTILFLGDYENFIVGRNQTWRACRRACGRDPRCKAWTFIKTTRQCRLKYFAGPKFSNSCCISGKRPKPVQQSRQSFCADYAREALDAQDTNLAERCGYSGPRWHRSHARHYRWCLRADRADVRAETRRRANDLKHCTNLAARLKKARCDHFARLAVEQSRTAERASCDFDGPLWSTRLSAHKRTCERDPYGVTRDKFDIRERRLTRCFNLGGKVNRTCRQYARQAVRDFEKSVARQCAFKVGARWSDNRRRHYRYCTDASGAERRREANRRARALEQCEARYSSRRVCNAYADKAAAQARQNRTNSCGATGRRWRLAREDHFAFCMSVSQSQRDDAEEARTRRLETCAAQRAKRSVCKTYSDKALAQVKRAARMGCGFTGRRWNDDRRSHVRFCMEQSKDARRAEIDGRERGIARCEARSSQCTRYVAVALRQSRQADEEGCGFSGDRWSLERSVHRRFCLDATPEKRRQARRVRRRRIDRCLARSAGCGSYARSAVASAKEARSARCGFRGERWSVTYSDHVRFCMNADADTMREEDRVRRRRLDRCTRDDGTVGGADAGDDTDPVCDRYTRRAQRAQEINLDRNCGFSQRLRWSSDYDHHYTYCRNVDAGTRRKQNRLRRSALAKCAAKRDFRLDF